MINFKKISFDTKYSKDCIFKSFKRNLYENKQHLVGRTLVQFLDQSLRFPFQKGGVLFRSRVDYPIGSGIYNFKFSEKFYKGRKSMTMRRTFPEKKKKKARF
eukprot:TRINITY_DN477_c0_g2_i1.p1 TRINITY_DN477_c0_g2~~TRINITY_DN477_c0_g2_i1.p1  ORF type:complete len:112 (-),score=18.18 TRINITY_DN477_c0_g2_i1:81-386(-)